MKSLAVCAKLSLVLLLGFFSSAALSADESTHETILLVSLQDGTVIKQIIQVDADICFKQSSNSETTCLTQGAPIIDPTTNTTIGFEMIEHRIDLVAKAD